jgi:hypothetical protein
MKTGLANAVIGRSPETLSIPERMALAGQWIAIEIYSPETLPLRLIAAIGSSAAGCASKLTSQGLDATRFEYSMIKPAY